MPKCSERRVLSWYYFFHFPFFSSCIVIWRTWLIFSYFYQVTIQFQSSERKRKSFFQTFQNLRIISKSKYVYSKILSWNCIYCRELHFGCLQVIPSLEFIPCGATRVSILAEDVPHFREKQYVRTIRNTSSDPNCWSELWSFWSVLPFYHFCKTPFQT